MKRIPAAERTQEKIVDTLILPFAQRQAQRGFVFAIHGTCVEFDFAEVLRLRTDDALLLDDGSLVEIVAEAEPLLEVRADPESLARLAWRLGDRHVPVEVKQNRLRLRREQDIEALLQSLGVKFAMIEGPFEPESGAYAVDDHHDHEHRHDDQGGHRHDHHGNHNHRHDHKRG